MDLKSLCALTLLMMLILCRREVNAGSKKVIIHVPYHVKNIKHTHTIYKIIKHEHKKDHEDWKKEPEEHYGGFY
ncbi:hypothetical protein TSAR_012132 [Trichomalopsis sarcophagae]|uniref:Uncharacterized protein n=1 Tax=Trichomalopsis sarcophagae TaxID=543379 RepID=A0A232EMC7_9HYME|nr:hypothetical protein TSAR_012132 [Trichomalopsis sarcophagae]